MKTQLRFFIPLLLAFHFHHTSFAQRFDTQLLFGINFAEQRGGDITDFMGLNVGVKTSRRLNDHWRMGMELALSQQGEYLLVDSYPNLPITQIKLNFLEIPLHLEWKALEKEEKSIWLHCGMAYARLLTYRVQARDIGDVSDQIVWKKKSAMLITAGITRFFSQHIGINLRAAQSLQSLQLSPSLSFRAIYKF